MATYKTGTVSVTNGSDLVDLTGGVTGAGRIEAGSLFTASNQEEIAYTVSEVVSASQFRLAAAFGGPSAAGIAYMVTNDFTAFGIPIVNRGDLYPFGVLAEAHRKIEVLIRDKAAFVATSVTEVTIGTGVKIFTVEAGRQFAPGQTAVIADAEDPGNAMVGAVTDYTGTQLTVNVMSVSGAGTISDWSIGISGPVGPQGLLAKRFAMALACQLPGVASMVISTSIRLRRKSMARKRAAIGAQVSLSSARRACLVRLFSAVLVRPVLVSASMVTSISISLSMISTAPRRRVFGGRVFLSSAQKAIRVILAISRRRTVSKTMAASFS